MELFPLVTVVMPCYNHEKYVREAIESVLNQTYPNIEFIVVENGSTDGSRAIIQEYESRLKAIYLEQNSLAEAAVIFHRQENARGKYFAFMTSDDIWMPDKIEKQVDYLESHPECGACFTWTEYFDENMVPIYDYTYTLYKEKNRTPSEWVAKFWLDGNCLCAPSYLMRMEKEMEMYATASMGIPFYQLSDLYQWIMYLVLGNTFYVLPEVLVKMRKHAVAISYSEDAGIRAMNESASMCRLILEVLPDDMFIEAFHENFMNAESNTKEELLCEKMLLLLRRNEDYIQPVALDFFYKNAIGNTQLLERKYGIGMEQINSICSTKGVAVAKKHSANAMQKRMEDNLKQYKVHSALTEETKMILDVIQNGVKEMLSLVMAGGLKPEVTEAEFVANARDICMIIEDVEDRIAPFGTAFSKEEWNVFINLFNDKEYVEISAIIPYLYKVYYCIETILNLC